MTSTRGSPGWATRSPMPRRSRRDGSAGAAPSDSDSCSRCGGRTIRIVYGLPTPAAMDAAGRGEIALGGCIIVDDAPDRECTSCGHRE